MDFELPKEDDPRRLEVRTWFEARPKPSGRELAEAGYATPHWPKPWGLGADAETQLIIDEEMKRARVTPPALANPVAISNCAQSLLTHGTDAQRERFLKPALAGEEIWCMLFSEPAGGSDLGSLRTTARREGDHYVVSGQKIWTSLAHKAQVGVLVVRTDPTAPKHAGLSQFLIDMDSPGITVRPIVDMSGNENEYNEVFFRPASCGRSPPARLRWPSPRRRPTAARTARTWKQPRNPRAPAGGSAGARASSSTRLRRRCSWSPRRPVASAGSSSSMPASPASR
jgi:3-oxochol-4-en-24-oyl-CoA dehydrogenase